MENKRENRRSYFYIKIQLVEAENYNNEYFLEGLDDDIDLVLDKMNVSEESYKFRSKDNKKTVIFFKPDRRKRRG